MIKFLIENKADVNHIDKAGYCPIDYAARNNNLEAIKLLLDNGADVRRENKVLVAKRDDLLKYVTDPECYRLLYAHVKRYRDIDKQEEAKLAELRREAEDKERIRREIEFFEARRIEKRLEKKRLAGEAYHKRKCQEIAEKERNDMRDVIGKDSEDKFYKYGHWSRDRGGHWEWVKTELAQKKEDVYTEGLHTMTNIRDKYKFETFNNRWKSLTDGHELEVKWTKSDAFEEYEETSALTKRKDKNVNKFDEKLPDEVLTKEDINYRDENDDLLDGVDIDDLLDGLSI
jgi:hypothetical protein